MHRRICQDIFLKLHENGWLEEQNKEQLYCEKDERFLADRYVEGICPKCNYPVSKNLPELPRKLIRLNRALEEINVKIVLKLMIH